MSHNHRESWEEVFTVTVLPCWFIPQEHYEGTSCVPTSGWLITIQHLRIAYICLVPTSSKLLCTISSTQHYLRILTRRVSNSGTGRNSWNGASFSYTLLAYNKTTMTSDAAYNSSVFSIVITKRSYQCKLSMMLFKTCSQA